MQERSGGSAPAWGWESVGRAGEWFSRGTAGPPYDGAAVATRDTPVTARERAWQEAAPSRGAARIWGGGVSGRPGSAWTMWGSRLLRACGAGEQRELPDAPGGYTPRGRSVSAVQRVSPER